MKVTCIGTDPAGLYLAVLLKRKNPSIVVRIVDTDASGAAVTPIVCNPLKPKLVLADREVRDELDGALVYFDTVTVDADGRQFQTRGMKYASVDAGALTDILKRRAARLGCEFAAMAPLSDLAQFADSDLIVAADGAASRVRALTPGFAPAISESSMRHAVFRQNRKREALSFVFRTTPHGDFHAIAYPAGPDHACFIVEAPEDAVHAIGLDEEALPFCRGLFGNDLEWASADRHGWQSFATVQNRPWHAGNVVLLGSAAYTSHVSVGLDVRSGLEDAEALAEHLLAGRSIAEALPRYEAARRPKAESLQRAAQAGVGFFETARLQLKKPFEQFVFSLLTNSMRLTYAKIEKAAPELVHAVDAIVSGIVPTPGANRSPPPMFAPITLRGLTIPNRVVVSPMCQYSAKDGTVNDWHLVHLGSRAVGGAGLVIAEMTDVLPEGRISLHCAGMYSDEHVPAWKRVVDFVHAHSASKIAIQLAHAGRKGSLTRNWEGHRNLGETASWELLAPSPIAFMEGRQVPREMNRADMDRIRDAFVRAAEMSDAAGFDMIELHFAHGYLLSSFMSPLTNHRKDEYGGSLDNRMRFPLEVFHAVRAVWPAGKPISTRISSVDWVEGGNTIEDGVAIARMLHEAGNDIVGVSAGGVSSTQAATKEARLYQTPFSDRIRNELNIPTMAVGGIVSHGDANTIVAAGRADMVAIARAYMEDAYFARHAAREQNYSGLKWPNQYKRAAEVQLRGE